jgi:hypothetical protein
MSGTHTPGKRNNVRDRRTRVFEAVGRENTMTSQTPQNLPLAAATEQEQTDASESAPTGPTVGKSDVQADAARSGADADLTDATRDSEGVPVGRDDLEADKRASGA